jgi:hypothetical protein
VFESCRSLYEWGYTDLWKKIDWDFIHMRQHYDAIKQTGVEFEGLENDIAVFSAPSESHPGSRHKVMIQLVDLEKEIQNPQNTNIGDAVRAAMSNDLKVHCDCKAFLYWGYQYILTTLDAAMYDVGYGNADKWNYKKVTKPQVYYRKNPKTGQQEIDWGRTRNAMLRGSVCKHLATVMKVFPFWWNTIAGQLQQAGIDVAPSTVEVPVVPQQPAAARQTRQPQQGKQPQQQPQAQQRQAGSPYLQDLWRRSTSTSGEESLRRASFKKLVEALLLERAG